MQDVFMRLADVPMARMFVLAGIIFLMFAVLGKVEGKIDPGQIGRIGSAVLGIVLMIIGVVMQYSESSEVRQVQLAMLQKSLTLPSGTVGNSPALTAQGSVTPDQADHPAIKVVSASFARGCDGKAGNATVSLSKVCDGKSVCDYAIEPVAIENPPANCSKDFSAEWKCGGGSMVYSAALPAEAVARNEKFHLACAG